MCFTIRAMFPVAILLVPPVRVLLDLSSHILENRFMFIPDILAHIPPESALVMQLSAHRESSDVDVSSSVANLRHGVVRLVFDVLRKVLGLAGSETRYMRHP